MHGNTATGEVLANLRLAAKVIGESKGGGRGGGGPAGPAANKKTLSPKETKLTFFQIKKYIYNAFKIEKRTISFTFFEK